MFIAWLYNQMIENLSRKVDGIMYDVQDLKTSINFISDDTEEKFKNLPKNTESVKDEIILEKFISKYTQEV